MYLYMLLPYLHVTITEGIHVYAVQVDLQCTWHLASASALG
jgi:hypothetical protein